MPRPRRSAAAAAVSARRRALSARFSRCWLPHRLRRQLEEEAKTGGGASACDQQASKRAAVESSESGKEERAEAGESDDDFAFGDRDFSPRCVRFGAARWNSTPLGAVPASRRRVGTGQRDRFHLATARRFFKGADNALIWIVFRETVNRIELRYRYRDYAERKNLSDILVRLLSLTLFRLPVNREDKVGHLTIEELEREGVVFLTAVLLDTDREKAEKLDLKSEVNALAQRHKRLSGGVGFGFGAGSGSASGSAAVPGSFSSAPVSALYRGTSFVFVHLIYDRLNIGEVPNLPLLRLQSTLSPTKTNPTDLNVLLFKWQTAQLLRKPSDKLWLSSLVPLRPGESDVELPPLPSYEAKTLPNQIVAENFKTFAKAL